MLVLFAVAAIVATTRSSSGPSATSVAAAQKFNRPSAQGQTEPNGDESAELLAAQQQWDSQRTQGSIVAQLRDEVRKANERVSDALVDLNSNRLPGAPALEAGLEPMKAILRGSEEAALATINA